MEAIGFPLLDWQKFALGVGLSVWLDDTWVYPDVAVAVSRQNGKTRGILHPRILLGLLILGESILHSAQNRELPRESFLEIAAILETHFPNRIQGAPRRANGQEVIRMKSGASYRILAPRQNAPRGYHADLVVLDEVREYRDHEFVAAILPTQNTSKNPQTWWASNAGDPESVVLNQLRERGLAGDESLAWMEWSAAPELASDDPEAWAQANPSLGKLISDERLERLHRTMRPEDFETEQLCRWVKVAGSRAIPAVLWMSAIDATIPGPSERPVLAIDIDPDRNAAALTAAWQLPEGRIGTDLLLYKDGDLTGLEEAVLDLVRDLEPSVIGFDPWTTEALAETLRLAGFVTAPVTGRSWVAACQGLLELLQTDRLRHPGRETVSNQLAFAGRKETSEGRWWITREREPIPAVTSLARAAHLASKPRPVYAIF